MKGPGLRILNDVRRIWTCPETGNVLKTPGNVTHLYSPFVKQATWMKLQEEFEPARHQATLAQIMESMEIAETEETVATTQEVANQEEVKQAPEKTSIEQPSNEQVEQTPEKPEEE